MPPRYFSDLGGHPPQSELLTGRSVFKDAYAVIPGDVLRDIVTSVLPGWDKTRAWVLARPMTGFAETFSYYVVEVAAGGGSTNPEPDLRAQAVLFVVAGMADLSVNGDHFPLTEGSYAYIPAGADWSLTSDTGATFHWVRKAYVPVDGVPAPAAFVVQEYDVDPTPMPDTEGRWATTRFVDPTDVAHDMHVNIVTFQPGASIPFLETHVMEHGIYILEGKAAYRLNEDWVEVQAGDFLWLRAFCPQACYAGGPGPFRYLLYKDVNRHAALF